MLRSRYTGEPLWRLAFGCDKLLDAGWREVARLGGIDSDGNTSSAVDVYEVSSGSWSKGPELPPGPMKGFGCSASAQGGTIYFSGMKGDVCRLEADGSGWTVVGKLMHPRFFHRLVPAGTQHLVAAGGEDGESKLRNLDVVLPAGI